MKNYKNGLIAFLWLIALVPLQAQWSVAHLSEPREDPYTVVAGSKILFVLGSVTNGSVGNKVDIYDTQTGLWTVHNLPFSGESLNPNPPVAAINELVFIVDEEDFTDLVQVYDANNNTWSTLTLSAPRKYASIGTAGEFVVFAGGVSESGQVSDKVDVFHVPTKVWHQATLSEPRGYIAITGLGNKIFMAGGYTNTGLSDRIDILNTDTWEASFTTLMRPRALIEAATVGNKVVLAGGGEFDFVDYTEVDIFDGNTESWSSANLTQVDFGGLMGSAVVGDKVYFEGGIGPDDAALMDVYDAAANTWSGRCQRLHGRGGSVRLRHGPVGHPGLSVHTPILAGRRRRRQQAAAGRRIRGRLQQCRGYLHRHFEQHGAPRQGAGAGPVPQPGSGSSAYHFAAWRQFATGIRRPRNVVAQ